MPITIRGIRLKSVIINPQAEEEKDRLQGSYQLISSTDKVLAEQSYNGYAGLKVSISPTTQKALDAFVELYKADIEMLIGLNVD